MGASFAEPTTLGRTGLRVSRLGLGSSYGIGGADLEYAFERGINYFYWGSRRTRAFAAGLKALAPRHRERMVVVAQTYSRSGLLLPLSIERALRALAMDYIDLLLLGWWNHEPPRRILDAARALIDGGKARHILISCHLRPSFRDFAANPAFGAVMVRYNAAHPGAEVEVFPHLGEARPGVVAYTATRWGQLIDPARTPPGEATPRTSDCYRFALTHPSVDLVLAGPKDRAQLDEALTALDRGPMTEEELAWMKRVGRVIRKAPVGAPVASLAAIADRLMGARPRLKGPAQSGTSRPR